MHDLTASLEFAMLVGQVQEAMRELYRVAAQSAPNPTDAASSLTFRPAAEHVQIDGCVDVERTNGGYVSHYFEMICSRDAFWIECQRHIHDGISERPSGGRPAVECHTFADVAKEMSEVANWFRRHIDDLYDA